MKTKLTEPTEQNHIDIFYRLLLCYANSPSCDLVDLCEKFYDNPEETTEFFNETKIFPRETSPETYEYYVSDNSLRELKLNGSDVMIWGKEKCDYYTHKIKITICEDE